MALSLHIIEQFRGRPARGALALVLLALAGCGSEAVPPRPVPWTLVDDSGRVLRLEVKAGGPPCDAITGVDVDERPDTVVVTVTTGAEPGARCGPGAAAILGTFGVQAKLREPLGSRTLRDGAR